MYQPPTVNNFEEDSQKKEIEIPHSRFIKKMKCKGPLSRSSNSSDDSDSDSSSHTSTIKIPKRRIQKSLTSKVQRLVKQEVAKLKLSKNTTPTPLSGLGQRNGVLSGFRRGRVTPAYPRSRVPYTG